MCVGAFLKNQRGNFLLQALLAFTLIFAFIPFVAQQLAGRDIDAKMYSSTRQIELAQTAARIFIRENAQSLPYNTTVVSGNEFADLLEPYGLPLGFVPKTALGQDISLVIKKEPTSVTAFLNVSKGDLSELQLAELSRRLGFYSSYTDNGLLVGLALNDVYSDVVKRNETNLDNSAFLTDLDMGAFSLSNAESLLGRRAEAETSQFNTLSVTGLENGRTAKNSIDSMFSDKAVFQNKSGEAPLSLTRGSLFVGDISAKTISKFGDTGNFSSNYASVYELTMTAGRTSFYGPLEWTVNGSLITEKINLTVDSLEIESFINASGGQDVYIDPDSLDYSVSSGIDAGTIYASNITMRDQTSDALAEGETGEVILDIRPAGTSFFSDVAYLNISNEGFSILKDPKDDDAETLSCRDIIYDLEGNYDRNSLSQYIICQYVFWQRLEKRIDIKKCLLEGKSGCL